MKPKGISLYRLAKDIHVPTVRISKICSGRSHIDIEVALRLSLYFGISVEFWTGIQSRYASERACMGLGEGLEKDM